MNNFVGSTTASTSSGTYLIAGPSVSSNASTWINNMSIFFNGCDANPLVYCFFSINFNFFENDTDMSLTNMLS
jgi:hypothetical protein